MDVFALMHKSVFNKHDSLSHHGFTHKSGDLHSTHANVLVSKAEKQCLFCPKPSHIVANCMALKRKQQASASKYPKGVGLIRTVSANDQSAAQKVFDEWFKPFIFTGFVSLTGKSEDTCLVIVLRDTSGSQSFILFSVLLLGATSACSMSTVVGEVVNCTLKRL